MTTTVGDFDGNGWTDLASRLESAGGEQAATAICFNGATGLADGTHSVTAWMEDIAGNRSPMSPALNFTLETTAPTGGIVTTESDPTRAGLDSVTIKFSVPVQGLELSDLQLRKGLGGNLLTGAQTLTTTDNMTWTLGDLSGLTATPGAYTLTLGGSGSGIADLAGNAMAAGATQPITVYARGDLDKDGTVSGPDIDQVYAHFGDYPACDMNHDGVVDQADVDELVKNVLHVAYGDANLDGKVDFIDFQTVVDHWQQPAGWATGDFTGDRKCDFLDFQKLLDNWNPTGGDGR